MTKFDDFLEWLEANPWIGLLVGVLVLCGFFRGLHYWKVPFEVSAFGERYRGRPISWFGVFGRVGAKCRNRPKLLSVGRRSSGFCCGGGAGGGISLAVLPLLAVCVDYAYRFTIRNDYFYVYKTLKKAACKPPFFSGVVPQSGFPPRSRGVAYR